MMCRQCSRDAARRGLCWRHYRKYLSGELQQYAEWLNKMTPYMREFAFSAEHGLAYALYQGAVPTFNCRHYIEPFAGLHDLVTTGVHNA